jgi:serine/threonine kinase PknH
MANTGPEIGTQFGPYLLKRLLGSGGMGSVYEAQDTVMDRVVALKVISGPYAHNQDYRQRLQREARIAGRLKDPHVVPVHSTGEIDGHLYVDMRLIEGSDLETLLRQSGPLPPAKAVSIVRQIASALDAAHAAGVLHRDVKPGNILITADDFAYLVDFGIANAATEQKLTQVGDVLGTWTYMAPERFQGDGTQVTASADTYALACVLFEALAGEPPFSGDSASLVAAHLTQPVPRVTPRVGLPPALDDVISRGMAKQPQDRYATSGEFARAAEAALATLGDKTVNISLPTVVDSPAPTISAQPTPSYAAARTSPAIPYGPNALSYQAPATTPAPQPAPARGRRGRWILAAAAILLVVAVVAGLGIWKLTSNKSAHAEGVDLSRLDVGHYGTKPRPLSGSPTVEEGRYLEALRLAEGIANPYDVDPILTYPQGAPTPEPKLAASLMAGTGTPVVQPVLEKYHMISGYLVESFSKSLPDLRETGGDQLVVMLTSFPNPDSAAKAAAEMDETDFAVNPENQHITIPGYPQAKAHYWPKSPSMAATMASGQLVASVFAFNSTTPRVDYLVQRIKRVFDLQTPMVEKLWGALEAALTSLPLDPDNMLSRTFVAGDQPKISGTFWSVGPRAVFVCGDSPKVFQQGLYGQAGIDRCSASADSVVLRTKDETAATTIVPKLVEADRDNFDHDAPPPHGLTNARCFEHTQKLWADNANNRFACVLWFGRYVAWVWSNDEKDVRRRAAAQYAILVNAE